VLHYIETSLSSKKLQGALVISNVAITDFKFSYEYNKAIENKVKAEQQALQAIQDKVKLKTQSEAFSQKVMIQANATAYRIRTEAKARAAAIKIEADALKGNPELIQLRLIEKWDGILPTYNGGGAVVPMLNVNSIMNPKISRKRSKRSVLKLVEL